MSFNKSFQVGLLAANSLSFSLSENVSFPPHSWGIFSLNVEFWVDDSFLWHLTNIMPLFSGLCGFWWEPTVIWIVSLSVNWAVSSLSPLSRYFCLVFRSLCCISGWIFLGLSCLGFAQLLKSIIWCLLPNLRIFQPYFSLILFSSKVSFCLGAQNK